MIRKFNYTGRRKIKRGSVPIDLTKNETGVKCFDAGLTLDDMALPENAHVYVEAYHRSGYQRFDFGTIGDVKAPSDRSLSKLSNSAMPLFRVKVVDISTAHGRILASVDKLRPQSVDNEPADSQSLLYVEFDDLGNRIWELDLDGDWPTLRLNTGAEDIALVATGDNRFLSLVYPEVVKRILNRILIKDGHTDPDCDDDWPSLWLKLAGSLPGMNAPPQADKVEKERWIQKAVEAFCRSYNMLDRFNKSFQEGK